MYRAKIVLGIAVLLLSEVSWGKEPRLIDFESDFDSGSGESALSSEFEGFIPPEEISSDTEIIDISSPKPEGRLPMSSYNAAMSPTSSTINPYPHPITDETPFTGDNDRKTLPPCFRSLDVDIDFSLLYGAHPAMMNPILASFTEN